MRAWKVLLVGALFLGLAVGGYALSHTYSFLPAREADAEESSLARYAISKVRLFSNDLLPDLVPLPPRDMKVAKTDGRTYLYFSTTYFNQGRGTLELRADPATAGIREDIERKVFQRIYHRDGGHRDVLVGTFLWHQEHLHYHFADFITYELASVDNPEQDTRSGLLVKTTFCLRDVSRVLGLELPNRVEEAAYKICGKELQGVSVGWGDTYYWDYPDQSLDMTGLPSGTYKLTFVANPELRLEETRYDNNKSSVLFKFDAEKITIETLEEFPKNAPEVEHIHLENPFGVQPAVRKEHLPAEETPAEKNGKSISDTEV